MFWCKFRYDFVPFLSAAKAIKEIPHYVRDDGIKKETIENYSLSIHLLKKDIILLLFLR